MLRMSAFFIDFMDVLKFEQIDCGWAFGFCGLVLIEERHHPVFEFRDSDVMILPPLLLFILPLCLRFVVTLTPLISFLLSSSVIVLMGP